MRVLLADGETKVRSALRLVLELQEELVVAGEAADATQLLLLAAEKEPDLLLLDWDLPELPAAELLRLLKLRFPGMSIIVMSSRPERGATAVSAGADAFVSKSEPPDRLLQVVRSVVEQGETPRDVPEP